MGNPRYLSALPLLALSLQACLFEQSAPTALPEGPGAGSERAFPDRAGTEKVARFQDGPLRYRAVGGWAVIQGDIVVPEAGLGSGSLAKSASAGRAIGSARWINSLVYYAFDSAITLAARKAASGAMAHWEANTPIRFIAWPGAAAGHPDHVLFASAAGDGCYSGGLGRMGGRQFVNLGAGCDTGAAIHEIGHTVGLYHEHCRADRDQVLAIDYANLPASLRIDYLPFNHPQRSPAPLDGTDFGVFDFGSVMLNGSFANALDPSRPVMTRRSDGSAFAAQRISLSPGDIAGVTAMYPPIWKPLGGLACREIGAGAGGVWCLGLTAVSGGYEAYRWNGSGWTHAGGAAVRLDVDPVGNAWAVASNGVVSSYGPSGWTTRAPSTKFYDIAVGSEGSVYGVSRTASGSGYRVCKWTGSAWSALSAVGAKRITVDNGGKPWIVNGSNGIQRWNGSSWVSVPGNAVDIGAGPEGSVYILENAAVDGGYAISVWNGTAFRRIAGGAVSIDVGAGGNPYLANSAYAAQGGTLYPDGTAPEPLIRPAGWADENLAAIDVGVGGRSGSASPWAVGADPGGGYAVYRKFPEAQWTRATGGGVRIDADEAGQGWMVDASGQISWFSDGAWIPSDPARRFLDVGCGGGAVYALEARQDGAGGDLRRWNGSAWDAIEALPATAVTVDGQGNPWIVTRYGSIRRWNGSAWEKLPGSAEDIAAGGGAVFKLGLAGVEGGLAVWRWNGSAWIELDAGASSLDADPDGNPWLIDVNGRLRRWDPGTEGYGPPLKAVPDADPDASEPDPVPPPPPPPQPGVWTRLPGSGDIVAFVDGAKPIGFALDKGDSARGGYAARWYADGQTAVLSRRFVDIDAGQDCEAWAVADSGTVFVNRQACADPSAWALATLPGVPAMRRVGAGPSTTPGGSGFVYGLGADAHNGGYSVYSRFDDTTWQLVSFNTLLEAEPRGNGALFGLAGTNAVLLYPPPLPGWSQDRLLSMNLSNAVHVATGGGRDAALANYPGPGGFMAMGWSDQGWIPLSQTQGFTDLQIANDGTIWAADDQHRIWSYVPVFAPGPHPLPPSGGMIGGF